MGCLWQFYKALSVLFFTLFLVLLLVGVFLLAGIGAVEIPGLSRLFGFSVEPTPTPTVTIARETAPSQTTESDVGESGTPVPAATATSAASTEETTAIQRAEDAISQADEPGRFTIEVTDSDLTALLGEVIASVDSPPVSNLVVTFEQDAFVASGTITTPFRANIQATGHFVVSDDTVQIEFTEARLGALVMPKALLDPLTVQANEFLAEEIGAESGLRIESVEILPGKIVVTGERVEQ